MPRAGERRAIVGALLGLGALLGPATTATGDEPGGTLMGTVTGNGVALANTWVTLTPHDSRGRPSGRNQQTFTDATGHYEFPALPAGPVKLRARAPLGGTLVDTFWPQAYTLDSAPVLEVSTGTVRADLDLPEGGSAQGQVVEARTGLPVLGARVTATIAGDRSSGSVGTARPAAGPGRFSLGALPPVPVELAVSLPQDSPYLDIVAGRSGAGRSVRLDGGASTTGLTIGLLRSAVITGTVRDDAGAPVVGADVRLLGCTSTCPPHASTDVTGRYRLADVAPGARLSVVAQPAWGLLGPWYPSREATARVTDLSVGEGDVVESVDLTLTRPAFLSLDVLGADRVDPLRAIVRLTTAGRTYSQYFNDRSVAEHPSTGDSGYVEDPAARRPPKDSIQLIVGPVPPGEYSVSIDLGVADPGYLPSRWVSDSGTPSGRTIRLAAGEGNWSAISLAPGDGESDIAVVPVGSNGPPGWPGLALGFLDPAGWLDPSPATTA